ncbi:hypothetical protein M434DRAFT_391920 [Hypoxylon sp. CO27-5]|nr:hypothetical protein M434DRAFT_391920 [Hypoxylon sp. CO27-5]
MKRSLNDEATYTGQASTTAGAAIPSRSSHRYMDPNATAPSAVGSHLSGHSYPSRPPTPQRQSPVIHSPGQQAPGQQAPVTIYRAGYVPPERRVERERANRVRVDENSERRRRRERREAERRYHR